MKTVEEIKNRIKTLETQLKDIEYAKDDAFEKYGFNSEEYIELVDLKYELNKEIKTLVWVLS